MAQAISPANGEQRLTHQQPPVQALMTPVFLAPTHNGLQMATVAPPRSQSAQTIRAPPGLELPSRELMHGSSGCSSMLVRVQCQPVDCGRVEADQDMPPPSVAASSMAESVVDSTERETSRGNRRRQKQRLRRKSRQKAGGMELDDDHSEAEEGQAAQDNDEAKAGNKPAAPSGEAERKESLELSKSLKMIAAKQLSSAWEKLRAEFEVQKLIWKSVTLQLPMRKSSTVPAENVGPDALCQDMIRAALAAMKAEPKGAIRALEVLTRGEIEGVDCINNATMQAIEGVIQAAKRSVASNRLASRLELPGRTPGTPGTEGQAPGKVHAQMEALVQAAAFQEPALESRVRCALGLKEVEALPTQPSAARSQPADMRLPAVSTDIRPPTAEHFVKILEGIPSRIPSREMCRRGSASLRSRSTHSRSSHGSRRTLKSRSSRSSCASSAISSRSARSAGSGARPGGFHHVGQSVVPTLTPLVEADSEVALEPPLAQSGRMRGTPISGLETGSLGTPGLPDVAPWVANPTPGMAEAISAVERIRAIAMGELKNSWKVLEEEFKAQVLVWDSCAIVALGGLHGAEASARPESKVRAIIQSALEADAHQSPGAALALGRELQRDPHAGELLNISTRGAVYDVVEAGRIAQIRIKLGNCIARRLQHEDHAAQLNYSDLSKLIKECHLGDLGLEYRVRRVLGLPMGDLKTRWQTYRHQKPSFLKEEAGTW